MVNNLAQVTPDFLGAVQTAMYRASNHPDPAVRYAANNVPIYPFPKADRSQANAAGCPNCTYLGLWADHWSGYPTKRHGLIWLFEDGIRRDGADLDACVYNVLMHEIDHALQRDHILEAMRDQRVAAYMVQARP